MKFDPGPDLIPFIVCSACAKAFFSIPEETIGAKIGPNIGPKDTKRAKSITSQSLMAVMKGSLLIPKKHSILFLKIGLECALAW